MYPDTTPKDVLASYLNGDLSQGQALEELLALLGRHKRLGTPAADLAIRRPTSAARSPRDQMRAAALLAALDHRLSAP
jgi:hypothetical protein